MEEEQRCPKTPPTTHQSWRWPSDMLFDWWVGTSSASAKAAESALLQYVRAPYTSMLVPIEMNVRSWFGSKTVPAYINTIEVNPAKATHATPVVVAHGLGSGLGLNYRNYDDLAELGGGRRILAFDWLGQGRSTRVEFPRRSTLFPSDERENIREGIQYYVDSVEEWRKAVGIEQFDLIAHSLGGYFASHYALQNPGRVRRLVLVSPCGLPSPPPPSQRDSERSLPMMAKIAMALWDFNFNLISFYRMGGTMTKSTHLSIVKSRLASIQDEDEVHKLSEYLYHVNMAEGGAEHFCMNSLLKPLLHDKYSGVYARAPLEDEDLSKLSMPCTIIFGDKDWMNNPKIRETFMPKFPNAEMTIVSQAGHHLYLDQPEQLIAIVKNALLNERPKGSAIINTHDTSS